MNTFRPSSMSRIMVCPGSYGICKKYPNKSGKAAKEGTAAHAVAAHCLVSGTIISECHDSFSSGIEIDQEMIHYLSIYVDHIRSYGGGGGKIEERYAFNKDNYRLSGTPDFWHYCPDTLTLTVRDLKYGYGWVEAERNWQLLCYAMLILEKYPLIKVKTIDLGIVQPRANHPEGPIRSWKFDFDLMRSFRNQITNAMEWALVSDPETHSGTHCRYCQGLLHCHTAQAATGYALDYSGISRVSDPTIEEAVLDLEVIAAAIKTLEYRKIALEEYCIGRAKVGDILPGYECSPSVSTLKWTCDAIAMGDMLNVNLRSSQTAITPTQAISRKLLPEETIKQFAARETGAMKLKKINLKRVRRILNG